MTTPVPVPEAPRPITTPPDELVEATRKILPTMDKIQQAWTELAGPPTAESAAEDGTLTLASADFLRQRFPHLDDVTLAAFCAYVATNITAAVTETDLCLDAMRVAVIFAEIAKHLAWSLTSPDGQGHE